jgi:hypothetical protein
MGRRKKSKSSGAKLPRMRVDWRVVRRAAVAALWVAGLAGIAAGWMFGVPELEAHVSARHATAEGGPIQVRFRAQPAWMFPELQTQLSLTAATQIGRNVMDRNDLAAAREALLATGWFTQVRQVRRIGPTLIEVQATFLEPYALIRDREGDHLVDREARLIPFSYPAGTPPRTIVIIGARFDRPARAGQVWEGADVEAAMQLCRLIDAQPWREQVAGIDVTDALKRESIRLLTDRGTRIIWGRPPGEERSAEPPAGQKLSYLRHHFDQHGHIDRGAASEVDVSGDVVVVR